MTRKSAEKDPTGDQLLRLCNTSAADIQGLATTAYFGHLNRTGLGSRAASQIPQSAEGPIAQLMFVTTGLPRRVCRLAAAGEVSTQKLSSMDAKRDRRRDLLDELRLVQSQLLSGFDPVAARFFAAAERPLDLGAEVERLNKRLDDFQEDMSKPVRVTSTDEIRKDLARVFDKAAVAASRGEQAYAMASIGRDHKDLETVVQRLTALERTSQAKAIAADRDALARLEEIHRMSCERDGQLERDIFETYEEVRATVASQGTEFRESRDLVYRRIEEESVRMDEERFTLTNETEGLKEEVAALKVELEVMREFLGTQSAEVAAAVERTKSAPVRLMDRIRGLALDADDKFVLTLMVIGILSGVSCVIHGYFGGAL
jgi:hypothetical protein